MDQIVGILLILMLADIHKSFIGFSSGDKAIL
jgi:hypothetical protein